MPKRFRKQIIIAIVYLIIFGLIAAGTYFLAVKPRLPSCFDNIQNQGEAGIDCGGPCQLCFWQLQEPLEIISAEEIKTLDNYVDLVAKIKNPNRDSGAKLFSYRFDLYDINDNLLAFKEGSAYILPQQTRNIIEQKVRVELEVSKTEFKIINIDWQKLVDYEDPELLIKNQNIDEAEGITRLTATLENRSNYDFDTIDVLAVLYNKESKVVSVGKIDLRTVLSKENRYFEISWFFPLQDQVSTADVTAKTNVFLEENFMKRYGGEREKFQEY